MPMIYDEVRFSCSCGSADIATHNYDGEEYGMWRCGKCGYSDYPDAFDQPKGFINDECSMCEKETKHKITGIDNWDGSAGFKCTDCDTFREYKITSPGVFERVR